MKKLVILLVASLLVLHQDFWFWDDIDPVIFGFLPIGLAYHVGLSIAAAFVWALAAKYCWPPELDASEHGAVRRQRGEL